MLLLFKGVSDMPVLESTDKLSQRSALRHRPLPLDGTGKHAVVPPTTSPVIQRASRTHPRDTADELVGEWQRGDAADVPPTRRVTSGAVPRLRKKIKGRSRLISFLPTRRAKRAHPALFLGLGMLLMLVLWTLLTAGLGWWTSTTNYIHYGYPRTFQTDAVVGHSDSAKNPSHFLALNLRGRIEIIEFPGGDGSHARIFLGPQLFDSDADTIPVTLKFADVNQDHKPDMLVFFASSWIVFINAQGSFRPPTTQEQQDAVQYLAHHAP
jgi:hypothetical protein